MSDQTGRILVVDDDRTNRLKLSIGLQSQGHSVRLAENGLQALELVRNEPCDVVLLDIVMPEMDGFQVLEHMKADPALRDIPVIVISGVDEIDSVVRCIEIGAEDYLNKPFNPVVLRARLNSSLQKKNLRDLEKAYLQQELMLRQSEKLATLGKLSAGMAHELNNPAAAARRGAVQLGEVIARLKEANLSLGRLLLSEDEFRELAVIDREALDCARQPLPLDSMARSDLEAEVESWIEKRQVAQPWETASPLVELGYTPGRLAALEAIFSGHLAEVLEWLRWNYHSYTLVNEISQATQRVFDVVDALKSYSYMDQAPIQLIDVRAGLESTLAMLQSRLEGITIQREYAESLPAIQAYGSELNQVWTNLLDNALDAMQAGGTLILRAYRDEPYIVIEIEDNGPGIPAEIQPRVFDPFFTTKPVGQGSGLGLAVSYSIVVQKHKGKLELSSQPGRTRMVVSLPA